MIIPFSFLWERGILKRGHIASFFSIGCERAGLQKSQNNVISSLSAVLSNFPTRAVNQGDDIQAEINSLANDRSCSSQVSSLLLPPAALSHSMGNKKNVTGEGLHEYNKHGQDPKVSVEQQQSQVTDPTSRPDGFL